MAESPNQAPVSGGLTKMGGRARTWLNAVRQADDPRWQGKVVRPVVGWATRRGGVEFESLARAEWLGRRLLGQPLSPQAWHRMTFNDKVTYRRLRVRDPVLQTMSDKLSMREFVAARLGDGSLPALLKVAERADELTALTGPFVVKANHGSTMVLFVDEGEQLTPVQISRADGWLRVDYAWEDLEWGYRGARRLLLAEEYLHPEGRLESPSDYKLFAFDGRVLMMEVLTERFRGMRSILRYPDWTPVPGIYEGYPRASESETPRPDTLEQMLAWASELSRGFGFIRVDLYDLGDRVKVGELTPYPDGGNSAFSPAAIDAWLGAAWRGKPWRGEVG